MISATTNNALRLEAWLPTEESVSQANGASASGVDAAKLSAACQLLALMLQAQGSTQQSAKGDVEANFEKLEELKQELADAIQQAKEAADSSGFFGFLSDVFGGDIAKVAGAVAAAAAIVATGGAAGPVILLAVATAAQIAAEVGPKLGLDPKVCMGLAVCAAALSIASGFGSTTAAGDLAKVARGVETTAKAIQGGATAAGGVFHGVAGHYEAKQLDCQADATGYQAQNEATRMQLDQLIDLLDRLMRSEHRLVQTTSDIVANDNDARAALCNRI